MQDVEVITTVSLQARAATVLDQQYDHGQVFAKVAHFWPRGVPMPEVGQQSKSPVFLARVKTASGEQYAWPIGSPEETMASAMYFYLNGPSIFGDDLESLKKVAHELGQAMELYDLALPDGYADYCRQRALERTAPLQEEVWAVGGLPVTTRTQTEKSCELFADNEDRWSQADQVVASTRLKTAALQHGLDWDHRYAIDDPKHVVVSRDAERQLQKRAELVKNIQSPRTPTYLLGLEKIASQLDKVQTLGDMVAVIGELERLDEMLHMNTHWGKLVRPPADTFLLEADEDPLERYDAAWRPKEQGWDQLDLEKLASFELVPESLLAELRANPDQVAAQLPEDVQAVLKAKFMRGQ